MKFLKDHWPTILAVAGGVLTQILPGLTAIAVANPKTTLGILCACIVAAYNSTAPKDKPLVKS